MNKAKKNEESEKKESYIVDVSLVIGLMEGEEDVSFDLRQNIKYNSKNNELSDEERKKLEKEWDNIKKLIIEVLNSSDHPIKNNIKNNAEKHYIHKKMDDISNVRIISTMSEKVIKDLLESLFVYLDQNTMDTIMNTIMKNIINNNIINKEGKFH